MNSSGFHMLRVNFPLVDDLINLLQHCRERKDLTLAHRAHSHICSIGLESHEDVGNYIVPMFVECGNLLAASETFNRLSCRNVFSWTSLILGFVENEKWQLSLELYDNMRNERIQPSTYTFLAAVNACGGSRNVAKGRHIHTEITCMGYESCSFVGSCLIDMYAKCNFLSDARQVIRKLTHRNVVSWNSLITGYANLGAYGNAKECFDQMKLENINPDSITYVNIIKSCGNVQAIEGQEIHVMLVKEGVEGNPFTGNVLVDMYAKCGFLMEAQKVLDSLLDRDFISWTSLISGYAKYGRLEEAVRCFENLKLDGLTADPAMFACILKACGSVGALMMGREMHMELLLMGLETNVHISTALVDMYSKCGHLNEAQGVYEKSKQSVVLCNSMINGYGINNESICAIQTFERMLSKGINPDSITFLCLLTACSRTSLIVKGQEYMKTMIDAFVIVPNGGHLMCMVDLLARSGWLSDAGKILETLPYVPSKDMWTSLFSACKTYEEVQAGQKCFNELCKSKCFNELC